MRATARVVTSLQEQVLALQAAGDRTGAEDVIVAVDLTGDSHEALRGHDVRRSRFTHHALPH